MAIDPGYFIRESMYSLKRNWVMSLGAVITIFFSLLLVGVFLVTGLIIDDILASVEDKVIIKVFVKDGAATEDIQAIQRDLVLDKERVLSVTYVSKEEALERFKEQMKDSPEIWENLPDNPLPASLEVELVDTEQVRDVVASIKAHASLPNLVANPDNPEEDIKYAQDIIDKLFQLTRMIRLTIVVLVVMLAFVSMIFISNTIRLAIYARRKEIGIMRLVGASNWFIRTPFLLEGVTEGLLGALLAVGIIVIVRSWAVPWISENLPFLPVEITIADTTQLSLMLAAAGVALGVIGSAFALRRYLKV